MTDSIRQLILTPELATFCLETADLVAILQAVGLIGDSISVAVGQHSEDDDSRGLGFFVGPHFLQHISFMGCAPAIEFQPVYPDSQDNGNGHFDLTSFTYIYLPSPHQQPAWYADLQMAKPACPACHKRIVQPENNIDQANMRMTCPHCGQTTSVCDFNWREFGGCAQVLVSIVNVYPKEAIPSSNLLNQLTKLTQVGWRYFYFHGPLA